ncbi:MAG: SRPBCC domain-containing protein, partial [Pseudomonadota bacterium]
EETILKYAVKADVGGKVAQIGSRLLVSTSKKLAGNFFESFAKIVEGEDETEEAPAS